MTSLDMPTPERDQVDVAARDDLRDLFELETVYRRGPASVVCLARDLEYNQPVALKLMPRPAAAGPEAERAFHRAAAAAAALDHPHIVPLYGAGATDRFFWYSRQHIEGRSLAEQLRGGRPMELSDCLRLVEQVATALDAAHRLGVCHAALTPGNVLVGAAGDVHVTDFWVPWELEELGALAGDGGKASRLPYRAPEQLAPGGAGPKADQYALGALVCECLSGHPPLPAPDGAGQAVQLAAPSHVTLALARALSPKPEARFPGVLDFASALTARVPAPAPALPPELLTLIRETALGDLPRERGRRRLAAAVLVVGAVAAVGAAWALSSRSTPDRATVARPALEEAKPTDSPPSVGSTLPSVDTVVPEPRAPAPKPRALRRTPTAARSAPPPRPATPGRLFINATPWGQVYVDGELIGNTPRADVLVLPGTHRLRVARDGFQPYERSIHIAPGQELRLTDIVLQELKP
jgi:serine/threonine protein kinase